MTEREANTYSPLSLAFLGDSVYDMLVREYLLRLAQALDEHELAVLKRGRNATGNTVPKHAEAAQYRRATAVECLFGYLQLTGRTERITELFELIISENSSDIE